VNIILVVIDTLRYDHVAANGNDRIRTPNLDALAERSWVFERAFASSFPTIPHRTDLITAHNGRPFHAWKPLAFDVVTVPGLLAEAGYCTQLIHDTPHLVNAGHAFDWPFHAWTFIRGAEVDRPRIDAHPLTYLPNWKPDPLFDFVADARIPDPPDHTLVTYVRANRHRRREDDWNAARLFRAAAEFLQANAGRENFFLWVDCFDPHEPWDAPPRFVRMYDHTPGYDGSIDPRAFIAPTRPDLPEPARRRIAACYAAKVSWVDHCFGEMLHALERSGLGDNTAVVVTADHGTSLYERGYFGKRWPLHEQEAHVPLIVHVPGGGRGRSDAFVQPADIAATVLGLAGVHPSPEMPGTDLLAQGGSGPAPDRPVAVAGRNAHTWSAQPGSVLFTVFGPDAYLQWTRDPAHSRLFRYGATDPEDRPAEQERNVLWEAGLAEVSSRCEADLAAWLEGAGEDLPAPYRAPATPPGWQQYWNRLYNRW